MPDTDRSNVCRCRTCEHAALEALIRRVVREEVAATAGHGAIFRVCTVCGLVGCDKIHVSMHHHVTWGSTVATCDPAADHSTLGEDLVVREGDHRTILTLHHPEE